MWKNPKIIKKLWNSVRACVKEREGWWFKYVHVCALKLMIVNIHILN